MKKLLFILLFISPFIGFGQTIEVFHKMGDLFYSHSVTIDVQKDIKVEYISFGGKRWLDYGVKKDNGKPDKGKIKKTSKIYDGGNEIKFKSKNDIINFMTKYGFSYEGSDGRTVSSNINGDVYSTTITSITFRNNNN